MKSILGLLSPGHWKAVRYLISGGSAAATNLILLHIAIDVFGIWYIYGSMMAFCVAFLVSFTLQKFWTFGDTSTETWKSQMGKYLLVALINLSLNTTMLYLLVEYGALHPLIAQFVVLIALALVSFFVYQRFIFVQPKVSIPTP